MPNERDSREMYQNTDRDDATTSHVRQKYDAKPGLASEDQPEWRPQESIPEPRPVEPIMTPEPVTPTAN